MYDYILGAIVSGSLVVVSGFGLQVEVGPSLIVNTGQTARLSVTDNYTMQQFGVGAEDELRAIDVAHPTYHPQVTQHGLFIQGSK